MKKISKNNTIKNQKLHSSGFTLVEVLIALTIFSIAVAGVITVSVQGNLNIHSARNKMVANYLADEGVELMRALRDTAVVNAGVGSESTVGWPAFTAMTASVCTATAPCDIDATNYANSDPYPSASNILNCTTVSSDGFCPIYYIPAHGYYTSMIAGFPGTPQTAFSRNIMLIPISADEMRIVVTVHWMEGTVQKTVEQVESVYNWYI